MSTSVTGVGSCVATDRELEVMTALRRLGPAFDPEPGTRDATKHRLMMVLTAMRAEVVSAPRVSIAG
jgi:hypothetical protein